MILTSLLVLAALAVIVLTAAATALRSVGRLWLRHWAEQRLRGSTVAELYLERPQRLLLGAGIATVVVTSLAGAIIGTRFADQPFAVLGALAVTALVFFGVGQVVARVVARHWATSLLPALLPVLRAVEFLMTPLIAAAPLTERRLERYTPIDLEPTGRDEIDELLRDGEVEGIVEAEERAIITGVAEFGATEVHSVMTPRGEIFALSDDLSPRTMALQIAQSAYSRIPVYRGSIDHVVGMVHVFDVLKAGAERAPEVRPVAQTLETTRCSELLFRMLRLSQHLAVVHDVEGRTVGLVTLEDLLEELVGDIRDEHDEPHSPRAA